ncbi:hypothetical protein ID866_2694 [Astraeus odoratus]|nr:hypothetical protein ID866_2694 [Astraeus odoratus]
MEAKRRQLFQDPNLYPEFFKPGQRKSSGEPPESVISISSSTTGSSVASSATSATSVTSSAALRTFKGNKGRPILISSDEEGSEGEVLLTNKEEPKQQENRTQSTDIHHPISTRDSSLIQTLDRALPQASQWKSVPAPIEIPTQKARPLPFNANTNTNKNVNVKVDGETFDLPDEQGGYDPRMSSAETEKALRALVEDSMDSANGDVEIDMKDAVVDGFKEGVMLLPHQVQGKLWMRERESGVKRGGILADDMGLGKTIQTLTRIVEGRARKSDKADGWAASTLVICPVSLVSQWASEISRMTVGLRVIEHHGQNRTTDPYTLQNAHVVITSYTTAASEHATFAPEVKNESGKSKSKKSGKSKDHNIADSNSDLDSSDGLTKKLNAKVKMGKSKDALFRVKWFRIVLDEAHNIKNRNTKAANACCSLQAKYRWCLTGTPMFLRVMPLNDWHTFNEQIAKPVKSGRPGRAMKRLQLVLKAIMLRRTKNQILNGKPLLELPDRKLQLIECQFDDDEKEFYTRLERRMSTEVNKLVNENENVNYTHVLLLLLRLRQACNHPSLVSKDYHVDKDAADPKPAKDGEDEAEDLAAMFGQMGVTNAKKCQLCQTSLPVGDDSAHCGACASLAATSRQRFVNQKHPNLPPESAKIRKILDILKEINERSGGVEKTIIFSQFTSMLDLIEPFLDAEGVKHVRYDGSMQKDKRDASLEKIRNSKNTRCILISFKAGSTGLNLTACNNVILVDMWWNPALEDQAYDRAHRLGQTRDVNIYKLMIPETVEMRILQLQDAKRELAKAALSGDKLKNKGLGRDDLLALFKRIDDDDEDD